MVVNNAEGVPAQIQPFEVLLLGGLAVYFVDFLLNHLRVQGVQIHVFNTTSLGPFLKVCKSVNLVVFSSYQQLAVLILQTALVEMGSPGQRPN